MDFFINRNGTLPTLKMELISDGRNDYKHFHEAIQNANIYFTMVNVDNGIVKIGKQPAGCMLKTDVPLDSEEEYYITYDWRVKDTNTPGTYRGQFEIDFLDGGGTLIVPLREELIIHINEGGIKKS